MLGALAVAWFIFVFFLLVADRQQVIYFQADDIRHDSDCAYIFEVVDRPVGWPVTRFIGDSASAAPSSKMVLLEDGRPLGPAHATHDDIRGQGAGRYSHWGQSIYFSSSDCTDPRTNGKSYEASATASISKTTGLISLLAFLTLITSIKRSSYLTLITSIKRSSYSSKVPDFLLLFQRATPTLASGMVLFAILILSAGCLFAWIWGTGKSINLAVAGAFQISDSLMYWICSNALLDGGNFGTSTGEWCQRRSAYPTFLSGITWLAQRSIFLTLLLQALVVVAVITLFARRSSNYVGITGALVCGALLFRYASTDLFFLTMTENAGLIFGCLGFSILLLAIERRSLRLMMVGMILVSIALNARAGAFFVLPLLILWAGIAALQLRQRIWHWITVASLALLVGFALQSLLVLAVGGSPGNSHGNFSYTLYGLSVGGKGWSQVLIDYPELSGSDAMMSKAIYALAWQNIASQPELMLTGLLRNIGYPIIIGTYGYEKLYGVGFYARIFYWLAWIPLFINRRNPVYLLFALSSLGILLSAPFLLSDGGPRVFAATVGVDVFQISLGFTWTLLTLTRGLRQALRQNSTNVMSSSSKAPIEVLFSAGLFLILLIPFVTTNTRHNLLQGIHPPNCNEGDYAVTTQIGKNGSMLLDFVDEGQPVDFLAGQTRRSTFFNNLDTGYWWGDEVRLFHGNSLLLAYQQDFEDPSAPGPYPVYSDLHLSAYHGHVVRLCIDREKEQAVFGIKYRKLNSITVLDES